MTSPSSLALRTNERKSLMDFSAKLSGAQRISKRVRLKTALDFICLAVVKPLSCIEDRIYSSKHLSRYCQPTLRSEIENDTRLCFLVTLLIPTAQTAGNPHPI